MLPLVSSITTTEKASGSLLNSVERHRLAVVEHLEVVACQVGHEPLGRVEDRDVQRHDLRAGLERRLLRGSTTGRAASRGKRQTQHGGTFA